MRLSVLFTFNSSLFFFFSQLMSLASCENFKWWSTKPKPEKMLNNKYYTSCAYIITHPKTKWTYISCLARWWRRVSRLMAFHPLSRCQSKCRCLQIRVRRIPARVRRIDDSKLQQVRWRKSDDHHFIIKPGRAIRCVRIAIFLNRTHPLIEMRSRI